jgi:hypothetical protein
MSINNSYHTAGNNNETILVIIFDWERIARLQNILHLPSVCCYAFVCDVFKCIVCV